MNKFKIFLKDFFEEYRYYYTFYSIIISTLFITTLVIFLIEYFIYIIWIELIILILPIIIFYFKSYERTIKVENFYYFEKVARYKQKPQIMNHHNNEIIIQNSKRYILFFQFSIGRRVRNYEILWNNDIEKLEIKPGDKLSFLEFDKNKIICNQNKKFTFIFTLEFLYFGIPFISEFYISSKLKGKIKNLKTLRLNLR